MQAQAMAPPATRPTRWEPHKRIRFINSFSVLPDMTRVIVPAAPPAQDFFLCTIQGAGSMTLTSICVTSKPGHLAWKAVRSRVL